MQQLQAQTPPQRTPTRQRTVPKPFTPSGADQPDFKGIWEPINYPDDLILTSVFFVTDQIGWIAGHAGSGNGGFILHTEDAGEHWVMQLGDPKSTDPEISSLRFLDARHGWAIQNNKILCTSDGANWEDVGTLPPNINFNSGGYSFTFTSPTHGAILGGNPWLQNIFVTKDGGRTWKQVFTCATRIEVNGLMVNTGCYLVALQFATPSVGYAVGGSLMVNSPYFFSVTKTEDGGESWRVVYTSDTTIGHAESVFFQDENNGVTKAADGKFYRTTDGGLTWKGAMGDANWEELPLFFPDSQVGWSAGSRRVSFTTDGGAHWSSRNLAFPADVLAFSFPSRHRGYAVGWHGMIYRYSVVPANYQAAAHSLEAPAMPGYAFSLESDVQKVRLEIQALQAKLEAARAQAGNQPADAASSSAVSGQTEGSAQTAAAGGFSQDVSAGGAFTQDTLVAGGFTPSAADSGASAETPGGGGSFVQDTGPPSSFIQSCCATDVLNLQNSMGIFTQNVSAVTTKYRTLNLILEGIKLFSELVGKAQGLRTSFRTLRSARDAQSALAALTQFSTTLDDMARTAASRFQGQTGMSVIQAQPQVPFPQRP